MGVQRILCPNRVHFQFWDVPIGPFGTAVHCSLCSENGQNRGQNSTHFLKRSPNERATAKLLGSRSFAADTPPFHSEYRYTCIWIFGRDDAKSFRSRRAVQETPASVRDKTVFFHICETRNTSRFPFLLSNPEIPAHRSLHMLKEFFNPCFKRNLLMLE